MNFMFTFMFMFTAVPLKRPLIIFYKQFEQLTDRRTDQWANTDLLRTMFASGHRLSVLLSICPSVNWSISFSPQKLKVKAISCTLKWGPPTFLISFHGFVLVTQMPIQINTTTHTRIQSHFNINKLQLWGGNSCGLAFPFGLLSASITTNRSLWVYFFCYLWPLGNEFRSYKDTRYEIIWIYCLHSKIFHIANKGVVNVFWN